METGLGGLERGAGRGERELEKGGATGAGTRNCKRGLENKKGNGSGSWKRELETGKWKHVPGKWNRELEKGAGAKGQEKGTGTVNWRRALETGAGTVSWKKGSVTGNGETRPERGSWTPGGGARDWKHGNWKWELETGTGKRELESENWKGDLENSDWTQELEQGAGTKGRGTPGLDMELDREVDTGSWARNWNWTMELELGNGSGDWKLGVDTENWKT